MRAKRSIAVGFDDIPVVDETEDRKPLPSTKAPSAGSSSGFGHDPTHLTNVSGTFSPLNANEMDEEAIAELLSHGGPRKSMLLRPGEALAKSPIAYAPKFEEVAKKMPTHRWIMTRQAQPKSSGVGSVGSAVAIAAAAAAEASGSGGGGGSGSAAMWKASANPRHPHTKAQQAQHATSSSHVRNSQAFQEHFRKSTVLEGGVQQAWESTAVQQGPFRRLVFHLHRHGGDDVSGGLPDAGGSSSLNSTLQHTNNNSRNGGGSGGSNSPAHLLQHSHGHVSPVNTVSPHKLLLQKNDLSKHHHAGGGGASSSSNGGFSPLSTLGGVSSISPYGGHLDVLHASGGAELCSIADLAVPKSLPLIYSPNAHKSGSQGSRRGGGGSSGHHGQPCLHCDSQSCNHCTAIKTDLDLFDSLRDAKEERLYIQQLRLWKEQRDLDERNKTLPPDMMMTKTGQIIKRVQVLDEGPTILQLYSGMTHQDREDLYMSICGGLSFDINREKFQKMVSKVLAPRLGVKVTEEQILNMFAFFDVDGNGTISYFEYVSSLASKLLSRKQKIFIEDLFVLLYRMPFYSSGKQASGMGDSGMKGPGEGAVDDDQVIHVLSTGVKCVRDALENPLRDLQNVPARELQPVRSFAMGGARASSVMSNASASQASGGCGGGAMVGLLGRRKSGSKGASPPYRKVGSPGANESIPVVMYLRNKHITLDRVKSVIFEMRHQNPWFPHPKEEALAAALVTCFRDLKEEHLLNVYKFRMFVFCDDNCMAALELVEPSLSVPLSDLNPHFGVD